MSTGEKRMAPVEKFAYHPDPVTNELAATLLEELECQQDILGIFLSGSTANGGRDKYSDIDISLIVENRSAFKARLPLIVGRNVDILFSFEPDFLLPDFFIFYLRAGYKLDFYLFNPKDSLQTSFSEQAFILKDTNNLLASKRASWLKRPIQRGLKEKYLSMALADIWAIRREIHRKNIFEARYNLDDARQCIATYVSYPTLKLLGFLGRASIDKLVAPSKWRPPQALQPKVALSVTPTVGSTDCEPAVSLFNRF
jgi:predicted nucleotidyltransferase